MANYRIPDRLKKGFKGLQKISVDEVEKIASVVREIPTGSGPKKFSEILRGKFQTENIESIAEVVHSFGSLLAEEIPIDQIISDLVKSLIDSKGEFDLKDSDYFEKKLQILFKASENILIGTKALFLQGENSFIFKDARIVTDVRHIFNSKKTLIEGDAKFALIVHQLRITTLHNNGKRDFFMSLDSQDLLEIKRLVDRALEKQKLIENNYKGTVHFIDITE